MNGREYLTFEQMQTRIDELEAEHREDVVRLAALLIKNKDLKEKALDYESVLDAIAKHAETYGVAECARLARAVLE
jgi:hypothetical protein